MGAGILGYGVYIPKFRIKREDIGKAWGGRGKGENSVTNYNEDVITMAVEASQNAVKNAGINPSDLGAIYLGTASAPQIEQSSVGTIALTLGCKSAIDMADFGASPRASVAALKACLDAIDAGRIKYGLVIGSDCRLGEPGSEQESNMGAAAVAFVLGKGDVVVQIEKIHPTPPLSEMFGERMARNTSTYLSPGSTGSMAMNAMSERLQVICLRTLDGVSLILNMWYFNSLMIDFIRQWPNLSK